MIFCLAFLAGFFYWYSQKRPEMPWVTYQAGAVFPDRARNPMILRDDTMEKSFAAQKQTTVRMPYGPPNAFQRTIGDPIMLTNPQYQQEYQKNIREIQIDTVDWRIDPKFNSPLNNNTGCMHIPEQMLASISNWSMN